MRRALICIACVLWCPLTAASVQAQTSLTSFAFSSTGSNVIQNTGYVGTYLLTPDSGDGGSLVSLNLNASREFGGGTFGDPHFNIVVGDLKFSFKATFGTQNYSTGEFWLPAGTHIVRVERDSPNNAPSLVNRGLLIDQLSVSGGATFSNVNSRSNGLAAADSYVEHFRQGNVKVHVSALPEGTPVQVRLVNHAFNFGTIVPGFNSSGVNDILSDSNYTSRLLENFNMVVPENAGKWAHSENTPFLIGGMDGILDFAENNGLRARMHTLIWENQQPSWVEVLLNQAAGGSASAKNELRQAISDRIQYYVADRADRYVELDVLNEALRAPAYWNVFSLEEIAEIHAEVRDTAAAAGADTKLYINDFNILQHNGAPSVFPESGQPGYANWHRNYAEQLNDAGFGEVVTGIGVQYYPRNDGTIATAVERMTQVLQNFSVTGLPISITEFGVQSFNNPNPAEAAGFLEDAMRIAFGTGNVVTFLMWGFWEGAVWSGAPLGVLYDQNWNLTVAGQSYRQLMLEWTTDELAFVNSEGAIEFQGFWGDYKITIGEETFFLTLEQGENEYCIPELMAAFGDSNGDGIVNLEDIPVSSAVNANGGQLGPPAGPRVWTSGGTAPFDQIIPCALTHPNLAPCPFDDPAHRAKRLPGSVRQSCLPPNLRPVGGVDR